ncbi:hypothetical protein ACPOL_2071 [Acidisarcina polymorpha]|uniref:Uncharacterized protein n=1 Tax=Acidisarcina polymorpha TaxID=2211140 RepID=A0A2Z5FYC6_9BACT|nr:hypothetical protein ACPOL_2071 [Acidisarcina polymorpha]
MHLAALTKRAILTVSFCELFASLSPPSSPPEATAISAATDGYGREGK